MREREGGKENERERERQGSHGKEREREIKDSRREGWRERKSHECECKMHVSQHFEYLSTRVQDVCQTEQHLHVIFKSDCL